MAADRTIDGHPILLLLADLTVEQLYGPYPSNKDLQRTLKSQIGLPPDLHILTSQAPLIFPTLGLRGVAVRRRSVTVIHGAVHPSLRQSSQIEPLSLPQAHEQPARDLAPSMEDRP